MSAESDPNASLSPVKRAVLALEKLQARLDAVEQQRHEPIAVIGIGCRFPGNATDPQAFWRLLREGGDAVGDIPASRWPAGAPAKTPPWRGGLLRDVDGFDAHFFELSPREATLTDPQQRLLLEVAWEALEHAGLAPDKLTGTAAGVYVGLMTNDYALMQLRADDVDPYAVSGLEFSFAAGRLSYHLGLRGPSVSLCTACSSSLVAVHLACQSLRAGECDLALAGGVNVIAAPEWQIMSARIGALAEDGRCKSFDRAADGYGRGEGCGVLVLKRFSALREDDNVLALIRGSAVNHDGPSSGLTVPSGPAQQAVVRKALADAKVDPAEVSYVEAHGSGTALGDPIEIEALAAVLGDGRSRGEPLVIGSVKTNLGHLEAAAGAAALIKVVLSLQHREIPPHLHFKQLNPHISCERVSLVIPTARMPWASRNGRRIAGVSAFGLSGVNAHVVVEEAPERQASPGAQRPHQLLVLSAKTESALAAAGRRLAAHLREHPGDDPADGDDLADVAYTCQVGRSELSHRRAVVCCDHAAAVAALGEREATRVPEDRNRPVVFMFPGLGDQYVDMGAELYRTEPTFRTHVDRCAELLAPQLGVDLRQVIYPPFDGPSSDNGPGAAAVPREPGVDLRRMAAGGRERSEQADRLDQTRLAQPAVFVVAYALAQLWMEWGVRPAAMIGYSLGEYVAACLAGVLSLADALTLVAERARLSAELPAAAMLAVALPETAVRPRLDEELTLAAVNGPELTVIAGTTGAVAELERQLEAEGVEHRRLPVQHAFHSPLMAPVAAPLTELVAELPRRPPRIPYLSNVTGKWIRDAEAVDPEYWGRHLVAPVRWSDGIGVLWSEQAGILLEVGPGQALSSGAWQHPAAAGAADPVVVASLPSRYDRQSDVAFLLASLGRLWMAGLTVDWPGFHRHHRRRRLVLPTYPFERRRYWLTAAPAKSPEPAAGHDVPPAEKREIANWFYAPVWRQSPSPFRFPAAELAACRERWLLLVDDCGLGARLAQRLQAAGQDVVVVRPGEGFRRLGEDSYAVDPRDPESYTALLGRLREQQRLPRRIVHLWSLTPPAGTACSLERLPEVKVLAFYSLIFLAQGLGAQRLTDPREIHVVANGMQEVVGGELRSPEKAILLGPCGVIPREYPHLTCRVVDVEWPPPVRSETTVVDRLVAELTDSAAGDPPPLEIVAHRGDYRWIRSFEPVPPAAPAELREVGVWLITGGLGGLGLAVAEYLARNAARARLVLLGRSPLPPREQWGRWLAEDAAGDGVGRKIRKVVELEQLGAEVLTLAADVADREQMSAAAARAGERFGGIDGVIHAAGVAGGGMIQLKTPALAEPVLGPKITGTLVLDALLEKLQPRFLVLFSSSITVTGGFGEVDYLAANAFLDAYARYRASRHRLRTVAIDWGPWRWDAWQESSLASLPGLQNWFRRLREQHGITSAEGGEAFGRALASELPRVAVLPQGLEAAIRTFTVDLRRELTRAQAARIRHPRPALTTPYVAPGSEIEQRVAAHWQEMLGLEQVGIDDDFFALGGNSLAAMQLVSRLNADLGLALTSATLFEGPTVAALSRIIARDREGGRPSFQPSSDRGRKRKQLQRRRQRR